MGSRFAVGGMAQLGSVMNQDLKMVFLGEWVCLLPNSQILGRHKQCKFLEDSRRYIAAHRLHCPMPGRDLWYQSCPVLKSISLIGTSVINKSTEHTVSNTVPK